MLDTANGTADFLKLGLRGVRLRRTCEKCWGVRITDFANEGYFKKMDGDKRVIDKDVTVYEAVDGEDVPKDKKGEGEAMVGWQSILQEVNANLPIHEIPRQYTTAGKGKEVRAEQAQVAEEEE